MEMESGGGARDWGVVILLVSALIFSIIDRFGLSVMIDPMKHDLGMTDANIGVLSGIAFGLFYAFIGVPLGWLGDRWSLKKTIALGIAVWSVATIACGFAPSFGVLLMARIAVGAGEAALTPASYAIVHRRFPPHLRYRAMSVYQIGGVWGGGIAVLVAGLVFDSLRRYHWLDGLLPQLHAWQQTFVMIGLPGIFFVVSVLMINDGGRRGETAANDAAVPLLETLASKKLLYAGCFLGMAGINSGTYALFNWFPAILQRECGFSPSFTGTSYGLLVVTVCPLGLMACGWFADRLGKATPAYYLRIPLLAGIVAIPLFATIGLSANPLFLFSIAALLHFVLSMPLGVIPSVLQQITPSAARARVSACYLLAINCIGLGIAPTIIGELSTHLYSGPASLREAVPTVISPLIAAAMVVVFLAIRNGEAGKPASPAKCDGLATATPAQ